jgi:hypothetical protein
MASASRFYGKRSSSRQKHGPRPKDSPMLMPHTQLEANGACALSQRIQKLYPADEGLATNTGDHRSFKRKVNSKRERGNEGQMIGGEQG